MGYLLAFAIFLFVFSAVLELRRYIRKSENFDVLSVIFSVYMCVFLMILYFEPSGVISNVLSIGLIAFGIVLLLLMFIKSRKEHNTGD